MQKECVYVEDTPLGYCCSFANKSCRNPNTDKCDEPYWDYLMMIAEDYVEENDENF
jgi:hypothetical protein